MNSPCSRLSSLPLPRGPGALPSPAAEIPLNERRSAYEDMSRDNKAMQDDDTSNPGMLAVLDGEALWAAKPALRANPAPTATATPRPA